MTIIPWYVKLLFALALLGGVYAGFEHWKHGIEAAADKAGYDRADGEWKNKEAKIKEEAETKYAAKLAAANAKADELQAKFDKQSVDRLKENQNADKKIAAHAAALAARTERLSLPTGEACGAVPGNATTEGTAAAGGAAGEARTDLVPGVAAAFERIAADSARSVRDFNALQQLYNDARDACTSP